jgi:lathosterol oxidase
MDLDDAEYLSNSAIVNGAACHTMHHLYFNYNYGQFTTFWDNMGGTYRKPKSDGFLGNLVDITQGVQKRD